MSLSTTGTHTQGRQKANSFYKFRYSHISKLMSQTHIWGHTHTLLKLISCPDEEEEAPCVYLGLWFFYLYLRSDRKIWHPDVTDKQACKHQKQDVSLMDAVCVCVLYLWLLLQIFCRFVFACCFNPSSRLAREHNPCVNLSSMPQISPQPIRLMQKQII